MKDNLVMDIGENYEYIRTLIVNNIELKKIALIEKTAQLLSSGLALLLAFVVALFGLIMLVVAGVIFLSEVLESTTLALLYSGGGFLIISVIIYLIRGWLIMNPLANLLVSQLMSDDE